MLEFSISGHRLSFSSIIIIIIFDMDFLKLDIRSNHGSASRSLHPLYLTQVKDEASLGFPPV
jgi:hypothetical protein